MTEVRPGAMEVAPWIAFDFGGVLVSDGSLTAWEALDLRFGIPSEQTSMIWYERFQPLLDSGRGREEDLWRAIASLETNPETASPDQIREVFLSEYRPIEYGLDAMEQARARGWKIALATNNVSSWIRFWQELYPWMRQFDAICCSADLGIRKPDSGYYEALISMTSPKALFVDDKEANVEAAIDAGLEGILANADGLWPLPAGLLGE